MTMERNGEVIIKKLNWRKKKITEEENLRNKRNGSVEGNKKRGNEDNMNKKSGRK